MLKLYRIFVDNVEFDEIHAYSVKDAIESARFLWKLSGHVKAIQA